MERVSWIQNGSTYKRVEGSVSNVIAPPKGIYNIGLNPMSGWYLELFAPEFTFDYKLYGIETDFINHVLKAYNNTKGNMGILLNGVKGTGKSVTAKELANKMGLPIILVKNFGDKNDDLIEYLSGFNFDCIFFFDEFEKNFDEEDTSILQIMDGVYTSTFRRIFLLTTNETRINDNLISRPSRLRYIHEFGNLEKKIVIEYLRDNLKDTSNIDQLVSFIDTLQISTIDILKSICEEVNIFGLEEFLRTKNFFNIKKSLFNYRVLRGVSDLSTLKKRHPNYNFDTFLEDCDNFTKDPSGDFPNSNCKLYLEFRYLTNFEKPFKSWKEGDKLSSGYRGEDVFKVIKIDLNRNLAILAEDGDSYINFIKILNPNERPSIYNESLTNPYSDLF